MKDIEMHNGLSDKEVRNFLSEQISLNTITGFKKHDYDEHQDPFVIMLHNAKIDLENAQLEVSRCERLIGIHKLMDGKNWKDFDVSEYVIKTGQFYRHFIGTDEEFDKFMKDNNF